MFMTSSLRDKGEGMAEKRNGLPKPDQGTKELAKGSRAMVSTSHPEVTAAAVDVLRDGGNAVDALLTAMPLQHVVEPQMSTMAGGFGMLYWEASSRTAHYLNAELDHPTGSEIPSRSGPETSGQRIAVPGSAAGMQAAAERFGTRPWESYFAPAIRIAEEGFPMYSFLYGEMAAAYDRLTYYPSGRERYTPDGFLPPVGTTFRQPSLATALRRIAAPDGVEWFKQGDFARDFVAAVQATGGTISEEDLASYEPRWDEPLHFDFNGQELIGASPPTNGGLYIAFVLGLVERAGLDPEEPWIESPRAMAIIAKILATADEQAARYCQDPRAFDVPLETLLSPDYLDAQAQLIVGSLAHADVTPPGHLHDQSMTSRADAPGKTDSNHVVIVDEAGNWVTMLHTVYGTPFGTGLVVDGISVNSGNGFSGVSTGPGHRIVTPLTPTLAMRNGQPYLGIGTPGSANQTVALVLTNMLHYQMDVEAAIAAPRFRFQGVGGSGIGWRPGKLGVENRIPQSTLEGLGRLGIETSPLGTFNWHAGSIQCVLRNADGTLVGATDPRRGGYAAGL